MRRELLDIEAVKLEHFDFEYPEAIERLVALQLVNYDYWYVMKKEQAEIVYEDVRSQCRHKKLIPFARRGDNEDIACFEVGKGENVVILKHSEFLGYRPYMKFESVWDWFREAIETMIKY